MRLGVLSAVQLLCDLSRPRDRPVNDISRNAAIGRCSAAAQHSGRTKRIFRSRQTRPRKGAFAGREDNFDRFEADTSLFLRPKFSFCVPWASIECSFCLRPEGISSDPLRPLAKMLEGFIACRKTNHETTRDRRTQSICEIGRMLRLCCVDRFGKARTTHR